MRFLKAGSDEALTTVDKDIRHFIQPMLNYQSNRIADYELIMFTVNDNIACS